MPVYPYSFISEIIARYVHDTHNFVGRDRPLINGGSVIVGPLGDVLAGPLRGQAGLVVAEIDTDDLVRARYDFDVVGHYARPDVFSLSVDERAKRSVEFKD
ncbi:nitrilase domain protein [Burkholderia thailandensis MSMB121]|nr:nitrilase domain protein [Burkholderia thailandensis MSMB121]